MIFLAVFDGIRSKTPIAEQVTYFKEITTFTLLAITLISSSKLVKKRALYFSNIFLLIYLVLIATVVISLNDVSRSLLPTLLRNDMPTPYAMHFKNIESIVLVFVLIHYEHLTGRKITALMDFFVQLCIFYVLFTLLIYFKFDNTSFFKSPWFGRVSIGYPTSDAQILAFALAYLVFGKTNIKSTVRGIFIAILCVGVLMNATATGIISLGIIFIAYFFYFLFSGKFITTFSIKNSVYAIIIIIIFFTGKQVLGKVNDRAVDYAALLENKMGFVTNKINASLFGQYNPEYYPDISEELRKTQVELTFKFNKDFASLLLGGPISLGTFIENENYFLIRSYGYVGFTLYYLWIMMLLFLSFKYINKYYGRLLAIAIGILIITNSAIATTYLFGLAVSFGLFVSYFYYHSSKDYLEYDDV